MSVHWQLILLACCLLLVAACNPPRKPPPPPVIPPGFPVVRLPTVTLKDGIDPTLNPAARVGIPDLPAKCVLEFQADIQFDPPQAPPILVYFIKVNAAGKAVKHGTGLLHPETDPTTGVVTYRGVFTCHGKTGEGNLTLEAHGKPYLSCPIKVK